jgi:hypothetical protein
VSPPDDAQRRGRRRFLLVASLFFVPLATAILLYYSSGWRPAVGAHGELVTPPRPLTVSGLMLRDGRDAPADTLRGKWSLVLDAGPVCDETTRARIDELGNLRLALDKDLDRVRRVLLHQGACDSFEFLSRDADLLVLAAVGPAGRTFLSQFPPALEEGRAIYIVDPNGNLMMSYRATGSARGMLKDLERLLRLSGIG